MNGIPMKFDYSKTLNEQLSTFNYYKDRYMCYELELLRLRQENQQLKKQKSDVVEYVKEKIKRYESYIHDLKNGNYPSPTVRQERQELIFRIKEQKDLLRMLGEIDE